MEILQLPHYFLLDAFRKLQQGVKFSTGINPAINKNYTVQATKAVIPHKLEFPSLCVLKDHGQINSNSYTIKTSGFPICGWEPTSGLPYDF